MATIVISNEDKIGRPYDNSCPVCQFAVITSIDMVAMRTYNCCANCAGKWAEGRRAAWYAGWRPVGDELAEYMSMRMSIPFPIPGYQEKLK